jgi:hypothetical protein
MSPGIKPKYDILKKFEAIGRADGTITDANVDSFRTTLNDKMLASLDAGHLPIGINRDLELPERKGSDRER